MCDGFRKAIQQAQIKKAEQDQAREVVGKPEEQPPEADSLEPSFVHYYMSHE